MRTETFQVAAPPTVRIDLPAGSVRLETADGSEAVVELEGPREDEAVIEQRGDEIVVQVERKRIFGSSADHRVAIRAPHGSSVDASVASADIDGFGRFGALKIDSASGDVSFQEVAGAEVNTASGDVEIGTVKGAVKVNSASGDVEVEELEGDGRVRTASGDVRLGAVASGELNLQSASGDVEVGIARGSTVWMDVSSMSGDTSCELDPRDEPSSEDRPFVELKARTMSGDIAVKRA